MSLPPPSVLAERETRRLATIARETALESAPCGEGWMGLDAPDSWVNFGAGLGNHLPVTDHDLQQLRDFYASRGRRPRLRTLHYAHPTLAPALHRAGFSLEEQDSNLVRATAPGPISLPFPLDISALDPADEDTLSLFCQLQRAFFAEGQPSPGLDATTRRVVQNPRCRWWILRWAGEPCAAGGLELFEGGAVLIAAGTLPEFRCRGIQSAFIDFRVAEAYALGASYCLIASEPGGPTERNAVRRGFAPVFVTNRWRG